MKKTPSSGRNRTIASERSERSGSSGRFAAIDFETADHGRDSACALAVVVVVGDMIISEDSFLIRPPRDSFVFTWVHGIRWCDVAHEPPFREHWPRLESLFRDVEFIAAHNAGFDRSVLFSCCQEAGLRPPSLNFQCTVKLARQSWGLASAALPDVCRHLKIPLQHHQAASDARACAEIVIRARKQGRPLAPWLGAYRGRLP